MSYTVNPNIENLNTDPINSAPEKKGKKPWTRKQKIGATIAALSLATIGTGIGIANNVSAESHAAPSPIENTTDTSAETATTPTETTNDSVAETEQTQEQLVASLEIPVTSDSTALAKTLVEDRLNHWETAGVYTDAEKASFESEWLAYNQAHNGEGSMNQRLEDFTMSVAQQNAVSFAEALFGPNWSQSSEISDMVSKLTTKNAGDLQNYACTAWSDNSDDKEAFRDWMTLDSVSSANMSNTNGVTERTLTVKCIEHDNSDENTVPAIADPTGTYVFVIDDVNGIERIVSMRWINTD